jgi:lipopolysaccharide/colanic/teichoic acid biosynthesis glycosyltransferase
MAGAWVLPGGANIWGDTVSMTRQLAGPRPARTTPAVGPDMGQPDPDGPDLGRPDLGRPELGRPELGRPDLGRPELGRSEAPGGGALLAAVGLPLADLLTLAAVAGGGLLLSGLPGWLLAGYAAAVFAALYVLGLHRLRICLRVADQAGRITVAAALPGLLVLPWAADPVQLLRLIVVTAAALIAVRTAGAAALRAAHRRGRLTERAVLAGTGPASQQLAQLLRDHPELGLRATSCASVADLAGLAGRYRASRVIVAGLDGDQPGAAAALRACRQAGADVCVLPRVSELGMAVPAGCLDEVWGVPLIPLRRAGRLSPGRVAKRAVDIGAALAALAITGPVLAAAMLAVRLRLPRPVLFRQARVVGGGRLAEVVKLRTLGQHGDPDTAWRVPDEKCGPLGRFLRITHIDELPQLVSVLRGDMSLVGPRPERPYFARQFSQDIPGYAARQRMPAGMTGWAQVHGLNGDTSITDRVRFDNAYIEYWSFWLDLVILARTLTSVTAEVAVELRDRSSRRGGRA